MYVVGGASLEATRNTRTRTCGSDERLMLPPDRGGVPVVQSVPSLRCDIISELAPSITWLISALINRQAVTPGSRSYLMGGGISSSEVFPSELSIHTTIVEADMTGHFENFIIFFQDIGHDAFCSCLPYTSVSETGCSCLLLPPPMSYHPGNKNETSFSDRFVGFP